MRRLFQLGVKQKVAHLSHLAGAAKPLRMYKRVRASGRARFTRKGRAPVLQVQRACRGTVYMQALCATWLAPRLAERTSAGSQHGTAQHDRARRQHDHSYDKDDTSEGDEKLRTRMK